MSNNTLRSLRARIYVADPALIVETELRLVTYDTLTLRIIGRVSEFSVEDGQLVGTLEFSDSQFAKAAQELFETTPNEPRLSVGICGVLLQLV